MKLEDKVFFIYQNKIKQGVIIEITQTKYGYYYAVEFYDTESDLCKIKLDGKDIFTTLYKLLENLEDDFYIKMGELSKHE
jgi:hypothetical protein